VLVLRVTNESEFTAMHIQYVVPAIIDAPLVIVPVDHANDAVNDISAVVEFATKVDGAQAVVLAVPVVFRKHIFAVNPFPDANNEPLCNVPSSVATATKHCSNAEFPLSFVPTSVFTPNVPPNESIANNISTVDRRRRLITSSQPLDDEVSHVA